MLELPGQMVVQPTKGELIDELAKNFMVAALEAIRNRGVFHVALSGGSTPEPFYMALVTDPRWRALPWASMHVWIVDERCVPEDDPRSNIRMMRQAMLDHVVIPAENIHPMPVLADDPAGAYEQEMKQAFGEATTLPQMDFILLGMGDDAHTASLFPQSPALQVIDRWISTNDGERVVPPPRLTMTYPLINAGRHVAALVCGHGKHATLQRIAALTEPDIQEAPISGIQPTEGELVWYLDAEAAGQTPDE